MTRVTHNVFRPTSPQLGRLPRGVLNDLAPVLRPGEVSSSDEVGYGYFKLKRAERRDEGFAPVPPGQPRLLVVRGILNALSRGSLLVFTVPSASC